MSLLIKNNLNMIRDFVLRHKSELLVCVLALIIGIYACYPSLQNRYVFADDVMSFTYWTPQFHDSELFQNDYLTMYSKNYSSWGFIFIYYLGSFFTDPITFGNYLGVFILVLSALFCYKLAYRLFGTFGGIFASICYLANHLYVSKVAGGLPKSFAFFSILMFLLYSVERKHSKLFFVFFLQSLTYPMVFLISILAHSLSFLSFQGKKVSLDVSKGKMRWFFISLIICGSILCTKHVLLKNPEIGSTFSKKEVVNNIDFKGSGRFGKIYPGPSWRQQLERFMVEGNIFYYILEKTFKNTAFTKKSFWIWGVFLPMLAVFFVLGMQGKIKVPKSFLCVFLSGTILFFAAKIFFYKLFLPSRYIIYTIPLLSMFLFITVFNFFIVSIKKTQVKRVIQILVLAFVMLNMNISPSAYLYDVTDKKELLDFCKTLPKNTVLAGYPLLVDPIPTFSLRKVYVNHELAHIVYKTYWENIKKRMFSFFYAYYSDDPKEIYSFCLKNNIEYLVIDRLHFDPRYLALKRFYFKPFNSFISHLVESRKNFVLAHIPQEDILFQKGRIFVIHRDAVLKFLMQHANKS